MKGTTNTEIWDTKVSKSGDTMSGDLYIDKQDGTSSAIGSGVLTLGNNIPQGTAGNARGRINLFGDSNSYIGLQAANASGDTKIVELPNASGTLALQSYVDNATGGANKGVKPLASSYVSYKGFTLSIPVVAHKGYILNIYHRYGYTAASVSTGSAGSINFAIIQDLVIHTGLISSISYSGNVVTVNCGDGWNSFFIEVVAPNVSGVDITAILNSIVPIES